MEYHINFDSRQQNIFSRKLFLNFYIVITFLLSFVQILILISNKCLYFAIYTGLEYH
jgi:hypothetical protein